MRKSFEKLFGIFRTWETRFALTFVSLIVTLMLWGYDHFKEHNPRLKMEVLSRANVIDLKEQVSDLDVIYKGASLRSNNQTLAVVTLKISNDGGASIPINAYDPSVPVGVEISTKDVSSNLSSNLNVPFSLSVEPAITKAEVILASRNYFLKNVNVRHTPTNAIFNPVIIQAGDWFEVKLLVLHGEGKDFDMFALGEISGVKIDFVGPNAKDIPQPFWTQVFSGNIRVHLVRMFVYALAMALTLLAIALGVILPIVTISEFFDKKKRKNIVKKYEQLAQTNLFRKEFSWVIDDYIEHGEPAVITFYQIVVKPDTYTSCLEKTRVPRRDGIFVGLPIAEFKIITMRLTGLITKDGGKSVVQPEFKAFIIDFAKFITGKSTTEELDDFIKGLADEESEMQETLMRQRHE